MSTRVDVQISETRLRRLAVVKMFIHLANKETTIVSPSTLDLFVGGAWITRAS